MEERKSIPASIRCIVPFAGWMERHPRITNIILIAEGIALMAAVLFYDFTTTV